MHSMDLDTVYADSELTLTIDLTIALVCHGTDATGVVVGSANGWPVVRYQGTYEDLALIARRNFQLDDSELPEIIVAR